MLLRPEFGNSRARAKPIHSRKPKASIGGAATPRAMDLGNLLAVLIGLIIMFIMTCAGLGWYSRRQ